ncbi:glutathione synthase/RimK-type ligase-like ATP-grasp enzyme [Paraburkholderia sp. MM5496-R1]|uniref:MvdC/MvdD family ATP grasp protein n=1 Tax=Paraburkholderia sp. MM5496-R1 TaxID=2991065 RepID=UPI003D263272
MSVLIISTLDDGHAQAVIKALHANGHEAPHVLDLSHFPKQITVSLHFQSDQRRFSLSHRSSGHFDLGAIHAVWWRRPQAIDLSKADARHAQFVRSEWNTALQGLFHSMNAFWVNDPARDAVAAHKPFQLTVAQECGLTVPVTLMTSDPNEAVRFWNAYPGRTIFKQFLALPDSWRETRIVGEAEAEFVETVRLAPVIFQERVDGVADIRVTAVGDRCYAAATPLKDLQYPNDVRMNHGVEYVEHLLPPSVEERVLSLMARLGLVYGAVDLRLTARQEYVFFEVNPAGQYLYVNPETHEKVTSALANVLADPSSARRD